MTAENIKAGMVESLTGLALGAIVRTKNRTAGNNIIAFSAGWLSHQVADDENWGF